MSDKAKTLEAAETLSDMEVENSEISKEINNLKKMLYNGFEGKPVGFDRVAKTYASNDNKEITKLYDLIGGLIKGVKFTGNEDQLKQYLQLNHSIDLKCNATPVFTKSKKKFEKFKDEYDAYFLEEPKTAETAVEKILTSISVNSKELKQKTDEIKEEFIAVAETLSDSETTLKTVTRLLTKAKTKDMKVADVVAEVESKLSEQEVALDILNGDSNED